MLHEVRVYQSSMQQFNKDELKVCPYDDSHRVAAKRLQAHLIKCRRNHPGHDKIPCPFNAVHIHPAPEMPLHISTCPDRRLIENEINCERLMIDGDEAKGDTSVPSYSNNDDLVFSDNENWDQEVAAVETKSPNYKTTKMSTRCFWNEAAGDAGSVTDEPTTIPGLVVRRGAQSNQPFPVDRRPAAPSQARSAVVGMGRGRGINHKARSRQNRSRERSRPGPSGGASLAANFDIRPKGVERLKSPTQSSQQFSNKQGEAKSNRVLSKDGQQLMSSIKQIYKIEKKLAKGLPVTKEEMTKLQQKALLEARLEELPQESDWTRENDE